MVRVVIGTEPAQYIAQKVLEFSIRTNTTSDVEIHFAFQKEKRMGGTGFGFTRFYLPGMFDFKGRAIYLDADQVVLADIADLERQLDDEHAIALVQKPEGTFNDHKQVDANQSSVMVLDCAKLAHWKQDTLFDRVIPNNQTPKEGEILYRDFIYLTWEDQSVIQPLDPRWNHMNLLRDDTKLIHYTYVRGQPWKKPSHPLSKFWAEWLVKAMAAGYVTRAELAREVLRRHIHPYYLRYVASGAKQAA